jgi:hypothetical protein
MKKRAVVVAGAVWAAAVITGTVAMTRYKEQPGEAAQAPPTWPAASTLPRRVGEPTLVVFAHPMCPCTRATFSELARLMGRLAGHVHVIVDFIRPDGTDDDWDTTDLWEQARHLEGVELVEDRNSVEADRFGTETSGEVMLFSAEGALLFHGGITAARGHEGDSVGAERIAALVSGARPDSNTAPVFGCSLSDPKEARK